MLYNLVDLLYLGQLKKILISGKLVTSIHNFSKFPDFLFLLPDTNWTSKYPSCGGSSQSPINIDTDTAMSADYSDFMFSIGYRIAQKGTLENNGYSCKS